MRRVTDTITRFKVVNPWHIAVAILLLVSFLYLSVRASDEYRWSDWGGGDAQSMLSLRQWEEGGWLKNYLLFKPQGYAKVVELFDDPVLRHHAHGTCPISSPRVGPRLWYTHYPSGYLIPYAALFRVGLDSLFSARVLSIFFSVAALLLMYMVFSRVASPRVSFVAVLFYGLTPAFLGYADTIANQPIDDLLRFGFMLSVLLATRAESVVHRKRWTTAAWAIEFALSLSSFDSVFFVYVWLIGWDFLEKKGFRWKLYLTFALAPVLAHSLQLLQNVWYLGWADAITDIKDTFLLKHGSGPAYQGRFSLILMSLVALFNNLYGPGILLGVIVILYLLLFFGLNAGRGDLPSPLLLGILFLCGLAFVLVLPNAAMMSYEARQMIPFVSLTISGFCWATAALFRHTVLPIDGSGVETTRGGFLKSPLLAVPLLLVSSFFVLIFWYRTAFMDRRPAYAITPDMTDIPLARQLSTFRTLFEPVYFDVRGFRIFWNPEYVPGYPQVLPLTEYYVGSRPILCFTDSGKMVEDLLYIMRRSPDRFSPVLISENPGIIDEVLSRLGRAGALSGNPTTVLAVGDRYVFDLTNYLNWGIHEANTHSGKP